MTNKRSNQRQKTIYFNTDDQIEEKLFEYAKVVGGRNFSGWVKSLIYKEMQANGGEVPDPFAYLNAFSGTTKQSAVGVETKVEVPSETKRKPRKKEPVVEQEPAQEDDLNKEVPEEKEEVKWEREEETVRPELEPQMEEEDEDEDEVKPEPKPANERRKAASNFLQNMKR